MYGRQGGSPPGGHTNSSFQSNNQRTNDFGSDFIAFGQDSSSNFADHRPRGRGRGYGQRRPYRGRFDYGPPSENPGGFRGDGSFKGGNGGPRWGRGQSSERYQESRRPNFSSNDISAYFHPSMMENPWKDLEFIIKPSSAVKSDSKTSGETFTDENLKSSTSGAEEVQDADKQFSGSGGSTSP